MLPLSNIINGQGSKVIVKEEQLREKYAQHIIENAFCSGKGEF